MSGPNFNITTNRAANEDGSVPAGGGGGGEPVVISTATLASDTVVSTVYTNVPGGSMTQVSTWQASITTTVECNLHISCSFTAIGAGGTTSEAIIGYQRDSNTAVGACYLTFPGTDVHRMRGHFEDVITALPAGTYIIKVMASRLTTNFTINGLGNGNKPILVLKAYPTGA